MVSVPPERFSISSPNHLNIPTLVSWLGGTNVPTLNSSAVIEFEKNPNKVAVASNIFKRDRAMIFSLIWHNIAINGIPNYSDS